VEKSSRKVSSLFGYPIRMHDVFASYLLSLDGRVPRLLYRKWWCLYYWDSWLKQAIKVEVEQTHLRRKNT